MNSLLIIFLITFVMMQLSFSQPAFTSYGEIKVSQSPTNGDNVSLAVQQNGSCWVVWGNASQFLNSDLTFDGLNTSSFRGIMEPIGITNSRWGFVNMRTVDKSIRPIQFEYFHYYYLFSCDKTVIDTLTNLFVMHDYDNGNQGWYEKNELFRLSIINHEDKAVICINRSHTLIIISGDIETIHSIVLYDKRSKSTSVLLFENLWRSFSIFPVEMNMYIISPFLKDRFALLKRIRANVTSENGIDYPYHRYIRTFSVAGDTLSNDVVIDTVAHINADYAEKILLGINKDIYLFRRHQRHGDSIFVLNASIDGSAISKEKFLLNRVGGSELTSNYNVANLSQGRTLIVWNDVDTSLKKRNVYCGILDKDMNWLGQPKRINSDTTGNQYSPSVAVKGDTVYVAWLDTRNGERHVYMRRFQADQITEVENHATPSAFEMKVFPNPVREKTQVQFSIANLGGTRQVVSLRMFDLLGREVKTLFEGEAEAGEHTIEFNAENLPNGVYQVVLQSGKNVERKNIVLMR